MDTANPIHSALPSEYYPDYFKSDLGLGTQSAQPWAVSLDQAWQQWLHYSQLNALSIQPSFFSTAHQRLSLERLGFRVKTLTSAQITLFFRATPQLFHSRLSLQVVIDLANIYFPGDSVTVRRGRPQIKQRLTGAIPFKIRLGDREGLDRTLHVQLRQWASGEIIEEFKTNLDNLIPRQYEILVAPLPPPAKRPVTFQLAGPAPLTSRRL